MLTKGSFKILNVKTEGTVCLISPVIYGILVSLGACGNPKEKIISLRVLCKSNAAYRAMVCECIQKDMECRETISVSALYDALCIHCLDYVHMSCKTHENVWPYL